MEGVGEQPVPAERAEEAKQASFLEQDTVGVGSPSAWAVFTHSALKVKVAAKHS